MPGEDHAASHKQTTSLPRVVVQNLPLPLAPPDLIIQDELHLISGPMGSLVGIYEAVIDGMSTKGFEGGPVRPKIVASTATVRRAKLKYGHYLTAMPKSPPLGIDASDSFFAVEDEGVPGRL